MAGWDAGLGSSRLLACSAPIVWAVSHAGRVMIAGWVGSGDQIHWSCGTVWNRRPVERRRP